MGTSSFVDAKEPLKKDKDEHEEPEEDLYVVPIEHFDETELLEEEIDDEIVEGEIIRESDTFYSMSLSMNSSIQEDLIDTPDNENDKNKGSFLDKTQTVLDVAGFVPMLGAVPDIANGIIYAFRGDYVNMSMSFVAAIPGYGDAAAGVAKGVKYSKKALQASKTVKRAKLGRISTNSVKEQADFIINMAKGEQKKNVSLLWTNGTQKNAQQIVNYIEKKAPELNIRMLETTSHGIRMVNSVNSKLVKFARRKGMPYEQIRLELKNGTLWHTLEKYPDFKFGKKAKLEKIQRSVSKRYAKESSNDVIIEFYDKNKSRLTPGQANKAEINLLRKLRKPNNKRSLDGIIGVDPIK